VRKGRNDIVLSADGRKISGNAFKQLPGSFVLHHGTILVNSDMSALGREARDFGDPAHGMWNIYPTEELNIYTDASSIAFGAVYLSPSKLKLESKGVASVHARVANLIDINPELSHENVCGALEKAFVEANPHCQEVITRTLTGDAVAESDVENDEVFTEHYEKLKDWAWRFGSTPEFSHNMTGRVDGVANFDVHLDVIKGRIVECRVFTDALYPDVIGILEEALRGATYSAESIREALESTVIFGRTAAGEGGEILVKSFSRWLTSEISKAG
ncbi:hypothetical protein FOZ60_015808, partial [Perkinsus olseni]